MRLRGAISLWLTLGGAALGCARDVAVGHEDALAAAGASSEAGGAAGDDPSTAGQGGEAASPIWSADHETGSLAQWLSDGSGFQHEQRSGDLALSTERAHAGQYSFSATITTNDGELHQAMMGRDVVLREGRYGAWFFLPEAPRADYWVIMKLSNGADVDRFDIDIEAREGAPAYLRLFEHSKEWITEPATTPFPIGRWVHVEALYRSTPSEDGRVLVLQDGQVVLDSGPRVTADSDQVTFFCGSTSRFVTPSPFRLFIDDASIEALSPALTMRLDE